jgi:sigma-B regulation protein RsbU (phosphoserine phosphatase)
MGVMGSGGVVGRNNVVLCGREDGPVVMLAHGFLAAQLAPPSLPEVPGLDAAAHYHIASVDEVGGDFYDLFALGGDRWGLFLGDVCGKGASAAAATSLIRYTLRAAAVYDADPAAVLGTLNTVMHDEYERDSQPAR